MAIHGQSQGIKVGTAITLLTRWWSSRLRPARTASSTETSIEAKAGERRQSLIDSLDDTDIDAGYTTLSSLSLPLGLPFTPALRWGTRGHDWPALPDSVLDFLLRSVTSNRDPFLVDIDRDRLEIRAWLTISTPALSHDEIARRYPTGHEAFGKSTSTPRVVRETLLKTWQDLLSGKDLLSSRIQAI